MDYLRDPDAIHRESLALIRREADLARLPPGIDEAALRLVQACAMPQIVADLAWDAALPQALRAALERGGAVLCDGDLSAHGLMRSRLPKQNPVHCFLNTEEARAIGREKNITRAAAGVELWPPHLAGAVAVIGESPTALFRLLELIDAGAPKPAAILAFCAGFVGAAEAKAELIREPRGVPYLTLRGRLGGGAMAVAAFNALAAHNLAAHNPENREAPP